jgi:hypothetical protein
MFHGHDLKKLKSFKKIRQSAKLINMRNQFIHDLESILKFLPASDIDNDLDDEILIEVMELAESHFFYVIEENISFHHKSVDQAINKLIESLPNEYKKNASQRATWKNILHKINNAIHKDLNVLVMDFLN